jgi:ABC-type multidrug transport system ATPase subunit
MELKIDGLSKQYKDKLALSDFSACLTEGIYGLLGPNGAGKSTLLNITVGLLRQTKGNVHWNGENIAAMGKRYRDILGYMPQSLSFYGDFTVRLFLQYIAALKDVYPKHSDKKKRDNRISEVLEHVNLSKEADRKIRTLSGGMRQKLGIAQALLNEPKLIILDEPTAGLDPNERIRFRNLISASAFDKIVIWATHIVSDVESIANDIFLLKEGQIILKDSPSALIDSMRDKVWMARLPFGEVEGFLAKHRVCSLTRQGDFAMMRIVSKDKPHESALLAEPNLEDLYLYSFD